METEAFTKAYKALNPEQKKAVDTIEGPVMVIAGPGTGKTQILTLRIANILVQTDVRPENILALTFTESGARAMRERLARYIGAPAYRVALHTFHEFAGICIRTFPDAYERAVGGRPITDLEKIMLIESIIDSQEIKYLRPHGNPQFYVKPIMSALSLMKREYITPDRFGDIVSTQEVALQDIPKVHEKGAHKGKVRSEYIDHEKNCNKNRELLFVYRAYTAALSERRQFDYDDMIFETTEALLHDENMLRSLQEQYQYILADEHQDVNGSQNKILELLAAFHERPNIFVVGDEKQSIYRFQGASLENFLYFEEKFPHATTIALTQNYRSGQNILDFSHALITHESSPADALRIPLTGAKKIEAHIVESSFSHESVEHEYIQEKIQGLIKENVPLSEIAVIVRTNREVEEIADTLRKVGIKTEASADSDILMHPITRQIEVLLSVIAEPTNERALFEVLHSSAVGMKTMDLFSLMKQKSFTHPLVKIFEDDALLTELTEEGKETVIRLRSVLQHARASTIIEPPQRILARVLHDIGFLTKAVGYDPLEGARVIRRIYDEIEALVRQTGGATLGDIVRMFATYRNHGLALNAPYTGVSRHAVKVMTAHKAKGLEFSHVFIPHLTDSKWGGGSRPNYFKFPVTQHVHADDFSKEDDERKLLYVALTRAKEGLYLSHAATNTDGQTFMRTRLLEDVGQLYIVHETTDTYEESFDASRALMHVTTGPTIDQEFLIHILTERGLSATALNNYLSDPWNYFYRNVLRIPEVQAESAQFGTALHDTLRSIMKHRRGQGNLPDATDIKKYLEWELDKMPVTISAYTRLHERAFTALLTYVAYCAPMLPHETKEEFRIHVTLQTGYSEIPEIQLTGMLDRLDFDAEGRLLRVVDYKSGKPKTRGVIEGSTKDSSGDYKRQLVFYALLLSLHDDERLKTHEGILSFIEADEKGKIHEEAYTISEHEIEALKADIIRVVGEIIRGDFLTRTCDPKNSEYCSLVALLNNR